MYTRQILLLRFSLRPRFGASVQFKDVVALQLFQHHKTCLIRTFSNSPSQQEPSTEESSIVYRGALAEATLRLKRVSITTCVLGLVGMPLLAVLYGSDISATGQLAVGGTAIFAATGSTAALTYCISPYVHLLEKIPNSMIRATTYDIFARRVQTEFDPSKDVSHTVGSRPFCNFIAKGVPMYVHAELIHDETLRTQLVGQKALNRLQQATKDAEASKKQDDDFL